MVEYLQWNILRMCILVHARHGTRLQVQNNFIEVPCWRSECPHLVGGGFGRIAEGQEAAVDHNRRHNQPIKPRVRHKPIRRLVEHVLARKIRKLARARGCANGLTPVVRTAYPLRLLASSAGVRCTFMHRSRASRTRFRRG